MITAVTQLPPDVATERRWTGRDVLGHHFGRIPWDQSPIAMALYWKKDKASLPVLVGCYRIDLERLCKNGYALFDKHDNVVLRFQRTEDKIEIARGRRYPALAIGRNPLWPNGSASGR